MSEAEKVENVLDWSAKQGYILVGGGLLNERQQPGRDFDEEELPHYLLRRGLCLEVFSLWRQRNYRGDISGAWSRPLFAGGWKESTDRDTLAFNLQSPSLFVDLRFPVDRPAHLRLKKNITDCSLEDLRYLARQHCFAGYSLPNQNCTVYTRHHVIDWNFHPSFPRPRPNKWRAEMNAEDSMSFKEYSTTLDVNQIPVYMERWQRFDNDTMGTKYFAAMRRTKLVLSDLHSESSADPIRQAVLVIVGNHFAYALDRPFIPEFKGATGPGGPALVDFAVRTADRQSAETYLSLQGSYGVISSGMHSSSWIIKKSTHPWNEGKSLFTHNGNLSAGCTVRVQSNLNAVLQSDIPDADDLLLQWDGYEWIVFENSFSVKDLQTMFGTDTSGIRKQISRL